MLHPLAAIPDGPPRWLALVMLVLATLYFAPTAKYVKTNKVPLGMLTLELAPNSAEVQRIRAAWGREGIENAKRVQSQDDIWLWIYSTALALACVIAAQNLGVAQSQGVVVAWFAWLAGAFDFIENRAIARMLDETATSSWIRTGFVCALLKWTLVFGAVVYLASAVIAICSRH